MNETVLALRHIAHHVRDREQAALAEMAERKAHHVEQSTHLIRHLLMRHEPLSEDQLRHEGG